MAVTFTRKSLTNTQLTELKNKYNGVPAEYKFSYTLDGYKPEGELTIWATGNNVAEAEESAKQSIHKTHSPVINLRLILVDITYKIYRAQCPAIRG